MKKAGAALLGLLILSGCALPVPLRIATWAIDGISLLITKKSIGDHGISLIARRDCAMWRSVTGEDVCIDNDAGSSTVVADVETLGGSDDTEPLASFETASGTPASEPVAFATPRVVVWLEEQVFGETDPVADSWQTAAGPSDEPRVTDWSSSEGLAEIDPVAASFPMSPAERGSYVGEEVGARPSPERIDSGAFEYDPTDVAVAEQAPRRRVARIGLDAIDRPLVAYANSHLAVPALGTRAPQGIYFVVGSFRLLANARRLAGRHVSFAPMVVSAVMDGGTVFRVMVGPFTRRDRQDGHRRMIRAGIFDAWAINLDNEDWRLALITESPAREMASIAGK